MACVCVCVCVFLCVIIVFLPRQNYGVFLHYFFKVIDPVLIVAAGLSVQSPFTRTAFSRDESSSQSIRQPLESEHGDPFTLLNAFDEWIEVRLINVTAYYMT